MEYHTVVGNDHQKNCGDMNVDAVNPNRWFCPVIEPLINPTGVGRVDTNPASYALVPAVFTNVEPDGLFVCETFVSVVGNT
jgi:hypothetical protein